jgi:hypothetical protein
MRSHPGVVATESAQRHFQRSAERKSRALSVMIVPLWHRGIIAIKMKQFVGMLLASVCIATCPGCKPAPELEVTITPPKVTIPDNSKRGTRLATVSVRWSDGAEYVGNVRLTKNRQGAFDGDDHRAELDRDPVAGRLNDPPTMLSDERIGSGAMLAQGLSRARFVEPHQPTVADDIGG